MALELIKSTRTIQALRPGIKRLNDGGGLYLLPFAKGDYLEDLRLGRGKVQHRVLPVFSPVTLRLSPNHAAKPPNGWPL